MRYCEAAAWKIADTREVLPPAGAASSWGAGSGSTPGPLLPIAGVATGPLRNTSSLQNQP
jgi:hypothetical protein